MDTAATQDDETDMNAEAATITVALDGGSEIGSSTITWTTD